MRERDTTYPRIERDVNHFILAGFHKARRIGSRVLRLISKSITAREPYHHRGARGTICRIEDLLRNYHIEEETIFSPSSVCRRCWSLGFRGIVCRLGGSEVEGDTFQVIGVELVCDWAPARRCLWANDSDVPCVHAGIATATDWNWGAEAQVSNWRFGISDVGKVVVSPSRLYLMSVNHRQDFTYTRATHIEVIGLMKLIAQIDNW